MSKGTALTTTGGLAAVAPPVDWRRAPETLLYTLSSPRTRTAYDRAVREAMGTMGADFALVSV